MRYRSSVSTFAKALLTEAACSEDQGIDCLESVVKERDEKIRDVLTDVLLGRSSGGYLQKAKAAIPEEDWEEIIDYICRFYEAYGFKTVAFGNYGRPLALLPWLASVAVCALEDIGR